MTGLRYISLFSGIEAASVAWGALGFEPVAFAEIEPYCCRLLAKRYPEVPNLGDVSGIDWSDYAGSVDIIVGGSPCQAFSIAGRRRGLMDERGLLMFEYIRAIREVQPSWVLWENVPGVLSQDRGRAFATFIEELAGCGYCIAYRVLDAQHFGVAQRRRRVYLVGHHRAGCAAAVLFERESLRWDFASSREKRASLIGRASAGAFTQYGDVAGTLTARYDSSPCSDRGANVVAFQYGASSNRGLSEGDTAPTIKTDKPPAICIGGDHAKCAVERDMAPTLTSHDAKGALSITGKDGIRRLTPLECERLQGFPDGYTDLGNTSNAARYKALGNSMAVPVMKWIGRRIELVEGVS